jgi:murein DD-endopeptidase MepM/ murein hydrolase activator NlpD
VTEKKRGAAGLKTGVLALFPAREIYLRSGGEVKFIKISTKLQLLATGAAAALFIGWLGVTATMLANQASVSAERAAIDRESKSVASRSHQVNAYRTSVGEAAHDLEERQEYLEDLFKSHFGDEPDAGAVVGTAAQASPKQAGPKQAGGKQADKAKQISAALPEARPLIAVEARQLAFARMLTSAVEARTKKAEAAIRSFGLDPSMLLRRSATAQGGPYVPWKGDRDDLASEFSDLSTALTRMDLLERGLVAIPSGKPTAGVMLTSSYGVRRDPFNGHPAFHAGLDFSGAYGQPILSAARGRVVYVGQRQGYGNVVEVDHGNGIMTRYAHLSGFNTKVGTTVLRGTQIARMGSTGRSTGTHLHFEVRVNGEAINPRRFLEAKQDVLQVQQIAKQRFADVGNRG